MTTFTPKDWRNATTHEGGGDETTPISAVALEDLETRVTNWVDSGAHIFTGNIKISDADGPLHQLTDIGGAGHQAGAHYWYGDNGLGTDNLAWVTAVDVASATPYQDLAIASKVQVGDGVTDFVYASHNGADQPTLGVGPGGLPGVNEFTLNVMPDAAADPTMGSLRVMKDDGQTGDIFAVTTNGALPGSRQIWVEDDFAMTVKSSATAAFTVKNNGDTELFKVLAASGVVKVPFQLSMGAGAPDSPSSHIDVLETGATDSVLKLRTATQAHLELRANGDTAVAQISTQNASSLTLSTNGYTAAIEISNAGALGFYGHATTAQQVLATGGGATVDNVITALQNLGLVKQS